MVVRSRVCTRTCTHAHTHTHARTHPPTLTRPPRKLAVQWHPDKHPEDPEGAKAKFQEICAAYTALMSTNEDEHIEQLEGGARG